MKKKMFIVIIIVFIILLGMGLILYPKYQEKKEYDALSNKIEVINKYLKSNEYNIKDPMDYINEKVTSGERKAIEDKIDQYLLDLLNINQGYLTIEKSELTKEELLSSITDKEKRLDILNELKENSEKLTNYIDSLNTLDNNKEIDSNNKELSDKYQKIYDKINSKLLKDKIDNSLKINTESVLLVEYLNKDSNWKFENNKLVFGKRDSFNNFKKLNINVDYELIKDKVGPVITASDITITKGTNLNIKDKIKCEDKVDGKVDCKITGNYDTNKIGSYNIKILAIDESKNTTSKSIKLTVKAKVVNNKPYYIEVIRNHNVVIVYGLDSNNKYTKIVKVFICSVGKSSTPTPTGTFKTSDKSSWGWLVGNLYGQYYTRITGSILFHSVPYTKKAKNKLEWDEYNKLGTGASKGCVRMTVRDVKWIYDNCPRGTIVKIYDGKLPSGVVKPTAQKISGDSPNRGWDPTDPDKNNPWKK